MAIKRALEKVTPGKPNRATSLEKARSESCGAVCFIAVYLTPVPPLPPTAGSATVNGEGPRSKMRSSEARYRAQRSWGREVRSAHETPPWKRFSAPSPHLVLTYAIECGILATLKPSRPFARRKAMAATARHADRRDSSDVEEAKASDKARVLDSISRQKAKKEGSLSSDTGRPSALPNCVVHRRAVLAMCPAA